ASPRQIKLNCKTMRERMQTIGGGGGVAMIGHAPLPACLSSEAAQSVIVLRAQEVDEEVAVAAIAVETRIDCSIASEIVQLGAPIKSAVQSISVWTCCRAAICGARK